MVSTHMCAWALGPLAPQRFVHVPIFLSGLAAHLGKKNSNVYSFGGSTLKEHISSDPDVVF